MVWNHLVHTVIGVLASIYFTWSWRGLLFAGTFAAVVQGIDMLRIRRHVLAMTMANPEPARSEQLKTMREQGTYKYAQLYVLKVVWYTMISLAAAHVFRAFN